MRRLASTPTLIVAVVVVMVAVLAFVGASLVFGGDDDPGDAGDSVATSDGSGLTLSKEEADAVIPPPPPHDFNPAPGSDNGFIVPTPGPTPKGPESVEISGVVIPIPEGARYFYGALATDTTELAHRVWFGDSNSDGHGIVFGDYGLRSFAFHFLTPEQEEAFTPTLDALWELAQVAGTPSPPSVTLNGVDIPLPAESYLFVLESGAGPVENVTATSYYVRLPRSVLRFGSLSFGKVFGPYIEGSADSRFQATIEAVEALSESD